MILQVRSLVEAHIKGEVVDSIRKLPSGRPQILLIDEVDVFFGKEFYGSVYRPLAFVQDPTITALVKMVWHLRNNPAALSFGKFKTTKEYIACAKRFGPCGALMAELVKQMLSDVKSFDGHEYVVDSTEDKIGYKEQDGISFNKSYGFKTMFAYFKEADAAGITEASRDKKIGFTVDCGQFSYAEIPKLYNCIMGVTGTLKELSTPEKELLQDVYDMRTFTYLPSVYGQNKLDFSGDSPKFFIIEEDRSWFRAIRNEIDLRLLAPGYKRAVLVFFESTKKLKEFFNSTELGDIKETIKTMTERTSPVEKAGLVQQAASTNSITLLTREFGRGTDFICFDELLLAKGGVHVIQTFVSDLLSEETQIKGRTARQGNTGSFSLVVKEGSLERFGIQKPDIVAMRSKAEIYDTVHTARSAKFAKEYPDSMLYVADIVEDHRLSEQFVRDLVRSDLPKVKEFLETHNKALGCGTGRRSRTIVLMDATGSMSTLLSKAKRTVKNMFERAYNILDNEGYADAAVEMQFAVYRNYNATDASLLQFSPWESQPANLFQFMDSVEAEYGAGEEAAEIGLWHVMNEHEAEEINQVVLIGDMPANSREDTTLKRDYFQSEDYWSDTKFAEPVFFDDQLDRCKNAAIPVHAFHVDEQAAVCFARVASTTGGKHAALDIDSDEGANLLTDCVTECILESLDGSGALVEAYRCKFVAGYTAS